MKRMTTVVTVSLGLLLMASTSFAAPIDGAAVRPAQEQKSALDEIFHNYGVFELSLEQIQQDVSSGLLHLQLGEREYLLRLAENDMLKPGFNWVVENPDGPTELAPAPVSQYKGELVGNESAIVRLSSRSDHFGGYVKTANEWIFIEPLSEFVDGARKSLVVVYRDEDVIPDPNRVCGSEALSSLIDSSLIGGLQANPVPEGGLIELELAIEVDGNYIEDNGAPINSATRIRDVMGEVDGIYQSELGIEVVLDRGHFWPDAGTDPYTSNDAGTTLDQFMAYWIDNQPFSDGHHMFSGKDFNGGVVGIAYVEALCNNTFSYALSQDLSNSNDRVTVVAHEIGHLAGAGHSNNCSGVNCNGSGPIMCSFIQSNGSMTFANCSETSIDNYISGPGSCVN